MRDYIHIGTTPNDEPCLQEGRDLSSHIGRECLIYKEQIEKYYPIPPQGGLGIRDNEVVCYFNDNDDESSKWALDVESDVLGKLAKWDQEAKECLLLFTNRGLLPSDYFTRRM